MKSEITVEELQELLEENERNHKLILALLRNAGVEVDNCMERNLEGDTQVDTSVPVMDERITVYTAKKCGCLAEILKEEISDYEENEEELRSLKRISREKEEYEDLEKEVNVSGEIINSMKMAFQKLQERDILRQR